MSRLSETRPRFVPPTWHCRPRLESLEDRWVPSTVRQFDFGKPGAETLRPGYTEVSEFTSYNETTGYGWLPGANRLDSRDRGGALRDKLTRDFIQTRNATFAVDLPNGLHTVTLTAGDASTQHGIQVYLEGNLVDSFDTVRDQYETRTYVVNVQDGRLDLRLREIGARQDDNAVINVLEINTLVDPVFDRTLAERATVRIPLQPHGLATGAALTYTLVTQGTGATVNAGSGVFEWTPEQGAAVGPHTFQVLVVDTADPARSEVREFTINLQSNLPSLFLSAPQSPVGVNDSVVFTGKFTTRQDLDDYALEIDFGDGRLEVVDLDDKGGFTVSHTYKGQKTYTVTAKVIALDTNLTIATDADNVNVLPAGSAAKIHNWKSETVSAGQSTTFNTEFKGGGILTVAFDNQDVNSLPADVFVATYTESPVPTTREGLFFDVQLRNASAGDVLVVTVPVPAGRVEFGYFPPNGEKWVRLMDPDDPTNAATNPLARVIRFTEVNGQRYMVVELTITKIPMNGTVFTVGLAPAAAAPVTIRPPQANAGDGAGQTRSLGFTSSAQLALALTASRDNQLSVSSAARGSQAGESSAANASGAKAGSALSSTAGVGGNRSEAKAEEFGSEESASFWRWLQSDEGMMELWLQGIDPAVFLKQMGVNFEAPEAAGPASVFEADEGLLTDGEADHAEMGVVEAGEGEPADAPFIGLAFLPVLLAAGHAHHRSRRRKDEE